MIKLESRLLKVCKVALRALETCYEGDEELGLDPDSGDTVFGWIMKFDEQEVEEAKKLLRVEIAKAEKK